MGRGRGTGLWISRNKFSNGNKHLERERARVGVHTSSAPLNIWSVRAKKASDRYYDSVRCSAGRGHIEERMLWKSDCFRMLTISL